MADITDSTQFATTPVPQAAENIRGAKENNINPDLYDEYKEHFDQETNKLKFPSEAPQAVKEYMDQSDQQASVVKNDIPGLGDIAKIIKYTTDTVTKRKTTQDKIEAIRLRQMFDEKNVNLKDQFEVDFLNEEAQKFSDYGTSKDQQAIGDTIAGAIGMGQSVWKHKELIGAATAAGAGLGLSGGPLAPATVTAGATTGFVTSSTVFMIDDAVQSQMAQVYNELSYAKDPQGNPLDHNTKKYAAIGAGVVTGAIAGLVGKVVTKQVPWLNKVLSPKMIRAIITDPANAATANLISNIGRSFGAGGLGGGTQAAAKIAIEEFAKNYDGTEGSFNNSLAAIAKALKERSGEVITTALEGGTLMAGTSAVLGLSQYGANKARFSSKIDLAKQEFAKVYRSEAEQPPPQLKNSDVIFMGPEGQSEPNPKGGAPLAKVDPVSQATEVLNLESAFDAVSKIGKGTEVAQHAPEEFSLLRENMIKHEGLNKVWLDSEVVGEQNVDKKAVAVRNIIDPSGAAAASLNAPVMVKAHDFADLMDKHPDVGNHVKVTPEGPTSEQAQTFLKQHVEDQKARQEILSKLGASEVTPEEKVKLEEQLGKLNGTISTTWDSSQERDALAASENPETFLTAQGIDGLNWRISEISKQNQTPELKSALENFNKVKEYYDSLSPEKQQALEKIKSNTIKVVVEDALNGGKIQPSPDYDIFGENTYLDQTHQSELAKAVSPEAGKNYLEQQLKAKADIIGSLGDVQKYKMDQVLDVRTEAEKEVALTAEIERAANDPNLTVLERFTKKYDAYPVEMLANHAKPGYSPFAIDPETLPEHLKSYADDKQLKKNKVFVKGGLNIEESAQLLGSPSGEQLLKDLSTIPTREEIKQVTANRIKKSIEVAERAKADLRKTPLIKAYDEHLVNEHSMLESLKAAGNLQLKVPSLDEISSQARKIVSQMPVDRLNSNQFKVGERKSARLVAQALKEGKHAEAFLQQKKVATNIALAKEVHIAIAEVNRTVDIAKKFNEPAVINQLKEAGPLYVKAADEILDFFNLDPNKKGTSTPESYHKFVKEMIEQGEGNFEIPLELSDQRESINDLTAEQAKLIGDRLKTILHVSEGENEMLLQEAKRKQELEDIAVKLHEVSIARPDYNANKSIKAQGAIPSTERVVSFLTDALSMFKNLEHILVNADNGVVGGQYNQEIMARLKGIGKYEGQGEQGVTKDMAALKKHFDKIIDKFGRKEWRSLENSRIYVPEFKDIKALNYGQLSKGNLFVMMLNTTNEGNLKRLTENFGISVDTVEAVLDKHLNDPKYGDAAQEIIEAQSSYFPRVKALQERTTGVTPEEVPARKWTHLGIERKGGYYKITNASEMSLAKINKSTEGKVNTATGENEKKLQDHFYADDMTLHGHTESRTRNKQPLSISMNSIGNGFEAIIHDLNFREAIRDTLKIVTHPDVAKDLGSTIGLSDYNVVVNTIVDAAVSERLENNALFDSTDLVDKIQARARSGMAVGYIVGNASSVGVQFVSSLYAGERLGISGTPHVLKVLANFTARPHLIGEFYKFAAEIHPGILTNIEGVNENIRGTLTELMPVKNIHPSVAVPDAIIQVINKMGFKVLEEVDAFQKVIFANAALSQYMAGDAPGHSYESIMKLSPEERLHRAKVYASSAVRLTLTAGSRIDKAPIQKDPRFRTATMFWNDPRNALNNTLRMARESRQSWQGKNYGKFARVSFGALFVLSLAELMTDILKGRSNPSNDENIDQNNPDEVGNAWLKYFATAAISETLGNIPYVRDINYKLQKGLDSKGDVQSIQGKMLSDVYQSTALGVKYMGYMLGMIEDEPDELNYKQTHALGMMASYITGGIPTNALFKLYNAIDNIDPNSLAAVPSLAAEFLQKFDLLKKSKADVPPSVMEHLQQIRDTLSPPQTDSSILPDNTLNVIKQIESLGGTHNRNPLSAARGPYQFMPSTWVNIMEQAPELGLTRAGRTSKNHEQQEKAAKWLAEQNASALEKADIPITIDNIYAAHFLGIDKAKVVLKASSKKSLRNYFPDDEEGNENLVFERNPQLRGMTIKKFKSWIRHKVVKAEVELEDNGSIDIGAK